MGYFARYYVEFLWALVKNVGEFFRAFGIAFYNLFIGDVFGHGTIVYESDIGYFPRLSEWAGYFGVWGWICFIFVSILHIVLSFFIVYRLVQLIRRYLIFRGKEVEKDKLLEEVARLREQSEQLIKEKNQIFSLKIGARPADDFESEAPEKVAAGEAVAVKDDGASRFTKLVALDEKYAENPSVIHMDDADLLSLEDIVKRFVNFAASQLKLYYTEDTARLYFAGMATSKVIILEGISGTGKTSLPYAMGKFFNNNATLISVQPSWRDRAELIGYFNEFTKKFNETDFLSGVYEATLREDPNFIVLDEMNLARIEYYFADFLSIMEMPDVAEWKIDLIASPSPTDPQNLQYGKLLVPQNVWFIGTANNDDSTFTITDKVYDRAIALALNQKADYFDAPITESYICSAEYLQVLFNNARKERAISPKNLDLIRELDMFIQDNFKISFGNRIMKQLGIFVPVYIACGGDELDAIDFIVTTKILRKFNSLNLPFLTKELQQLVAFIEKKFGKNKMKMSVEFIRGLQKLS